MEGADSVVTVLAVVQKAAISSVPIAPKQNPIASVAL